jgi:hypothetical protein
MPTSVSANSEHASTRSGRSRASSGVGNAASSSTGFRRGADRAEALDAQVRALEHQVDVDRHERAVWLDEHADELVQLAAANLELHDRERKAREGRIDTIRRDPPEWVTEFCQLSNRSSMCSKAFLT